jgi:membrane protease YdiL (CAAX protease family)
MGKLGLDLVRTLAIVWTLVVAAIVIGNYYVADINCVLAIALPMIGGIGTALYFGEVKNDQRFKLLSTSTVFILSFAALLLPIYLVTAKLIPMDISIAIYIMFIAVAIALSDMEDIPVLENEPASVKGFAYGFSIGLVTALVVHYLYHGLGGTGSILIGFIPEALKGYEVFSKYLALYFIMLFVIAVPEEIFFRAYLFKAGRFAVTTLPAAIVSAAMWFGLHAVTRVPDYLALAMLGLVSIVLYAVYGFYGLTGSVSTHAAYNIGIVMLTDLVEYMPIEYVAMIILALALIAGFIGYRYKE